MIYLFGQFWSALMGMISRYPAVLDGIRLAVAGLFFESCRRGLDRFIGAIQRDAAGLGSRHSPTSTETIKSQSHRQPHFFMDLMEQLYPIGRTPPRNLEFGVSDTTVLPWRWYWSSSHKGRKDDEIIQAPVLVRPAKGKAIICDYKGYKVHILINEGDDKRYTSGTGMQVSILRGSIPLYQSLIAHARSLNTTKAIIALTIYSATPSHQSPLVLLRPWSSVILPIQLKEDLSADAEEFLREREFYRTRGLPWRRGYLLYGVPGSGKSSLIAALASKLGLDIYMVNLGAKNMDDATLLNLIQGVPPRSILLIEDVDCAFDDRKKLSPNGDTNTVTDATSTAPESPTTGTDTDTDKTKSDKSKKSEAAPEKNHVTLSGLLNALDGVASSEGRLLFCTTNYVERIDAALSRPGRCDVWLEFKYASSYQIRQLFIQFYVPAGVDLAIGAVEGEEENDLRGIDKKATGLEEVRSGEEEHLNGHSKEKVNGEHHLRFDDDKDKPSSNEADDIQASLRINGHTDLSESSNPCSINFSSIDDLANMFTALVPQDKVSVSAIQAYLMRFKRKPQEAVRAAKEWVLGGFQQGTKSARVGMEVQVNGD